MNFLIAIKSYSDFFPGSNIYKFWESYSPILCPFCCSC